MYFASFFTILAIISGFLNNLLIINSLILIGDGLELYLLMENTAF